jgi:hypothetical protein
MARQPGQVYFDPDRDVLYFGFRDGFVASDAQFATVMSMCDQAELAQVRHLAINDALFWVGSGGGSTAGTAAASYHSMSAASLTTRALGEIRARMPGLRELTFVPREDNPVYSNDACFVEPPMAQMRMHRQIQTAFMTVAEENPDWTPPAWRIMALSAMPEPEVFDRTVLGYDGPRWREFDRSRFRHADGYADDAS